MTEKQQYWIGNLAGEKALVTGDGERDRWTRLHGWSETTEPADGEQVFVWMTNPETGHPAAISWQAREYWLARGFVVSPPEEPVNPTRDPAVTATPEERPAASAPVKSAARSAAKEKEEGRG